MSRTLASLVFVAALAACGSKTSSAPIGHTGGGGANLAVTLVEPEDTGMPSTRTLGPADGSHFPAVSADGKTVVDLVLDAEDFSGTPIATVVFWTKAGKSASFELVSDASDEPPAAQAQLEEAVVTQINAKLAETTWLPIENVAATGESEDYGGPDTITLADGVTIKLDQIVDKFPAPGSLSEEMGGGGCGEIVALDRGFGSRELGFAVVFPDATLGGDDCFGAPSAGLAIVVPIP